MWSFVSCLSFVRGVSLESVCSYSHLSEKGPKPRFFSSDKPESQTTEGKEGKNWREGGPDQGMIYLFFDSKFRIVN